MLTFKAMYKFVGDAVHAEVLDFPGVISAGRDLDEARELLRGALVDMAETSLSFGETLPIPNSSLSNADSDLEEPIFLIFSAASSVSVVPGLVYEAA